MPSEAGNNPSRMRRAPALISKVASVLFIAVVFIGIIILSHAID